MVKSNPMVYDVYYVRSNCPFWVHAYNGKWKDYWEVTRLVEHQCLLDELDGIHHNLTADLLLNTCILR